MISKIFKYGILVIGTGLIAFSCKPKYQGITILEEVGEYTPGINDSVMTIAYAGKIKLPSSDSIGVGTVVLKTKLGANEGVFTYKVDFGKNIVDYFGQNTSQFKIHGKYNTEVSAEFGDLYVLRGDLLAENQILYFQATDNLLNGVEQNKSTLNGIVLTEISPKDTLKTRNEFLKK